ncbi:MAG: hypothetical protein HUK23_01820, partial [Sphaerochaetaceae bacterium]|nr:hypothetical protein [Sphaerochaetaceae bacterium]
MKRLLFIILLLVITVSLFAVDYKVLIYPDNEELTSYISSFFPIKKYNDKVASYLSNKEYSALNKKAGEALHLAYNKENASEINKALEQINNLNANISLEDFNVVLLNTEKDYPFIKNDSLLNSYICESTGADMIIFNSIDNINGFYHLTLYVYTAEDNNLNMVYESLSNKSIRYSVNAIQNLGSYFYDKSCYIIELDNYIPGTIINCDGKECFSYDDKLVLVQGEHVITLSQTGYKSKTYVINLNDNLKLDCSLELNEVLPLNINSIPQSQVYLDGKLISNTPYLLKDYSLPLSIRLKAEGYSDQTIVLDDKLQDINVSLKPDWLTNTSLFSQAKDDFYASYARSLIIFGARLALGAFGNSSTIIALKSTCSAALTLSIVDLVRSLFDYYKM